MGTAFPVSTGYRSALDLARGPRWEARQIVQLERVSVTVDSHTSRTNTVHAILADCRTLEANSDVVILHTAPRALVLNAVGAIIALQ